MHPGMKFRSGHQPVDRCFCSRVKMEETCKWNPFSLKSQLKAKAVGWESVKEESNSINSRTKPIFISRGRQQKAIKHGSDNDVLEKQQSFHFPYLLVLLFCVEQNICFTAETLSSSEKYLSLIKTQLSRTKRWLPCTVIHMHRKY